MDSRQLIESYINDVAMRLPRKIRDDVGLELRELLTEELAALAARTASEPDAAMTTELLAKFGRTEDVANRYRTPGFVLVEPAHAPLFTRLSLLLVTVQWVLTLPSVFLGTRSVGEWWLGWGLGALWWPGFLITYFAAATWIRRRWPVDPDTFERPWTHWILWLPTARDWQPAPLIALMVARLLAFRLAVANEQWRARTAWPRFGLRCAFVVMLIWAILGWDIFESVAVDLGFKLWLAMFVLVNLVDMGVWARRKATTVRIPSGLANGSL